MHISLRKFTVPGDDRLYWRVDVMAQRQRISFEARCYLSAIILEAELCRLLETHLVTEEVEVIFEKEKYHGGID